MSSRENDPNVNRHAGALVPVEQNNVQEVRQPRQPGDLRGLLRFAMEAGNVGDSNQPPEFRPLDPERRQFLENTLSSMTVDIIKELSVALGTLNSMKESNSSFDDTSPYANALDTILEYVDNLDIANDFIKLNGFAALSICLRCPWEDLRWRAAEAIAVCCQNNPTCQAKALEDNLLQPLLKMAENDPNDECKIKAFYAVSCIVRESEQGLAKFISLDGLSFMLRVMQLTIVKLQIKASFFLSTLVSRHPELKDSLYKMGFVEQLVALIQSEHSQAHEHIISSLLLLITDFQPAIIECRRPELHLQSCLVRLAQELRKEEAYREEVSYIQQILQIVFADVTEEER